MLGSVSQPTVAGKIGRYTFLEGQVHIRYPDLPRQGPEPDGDTVTFQPRDRAALLRLRRFGTRGPEINKRAMARIRFEGVDALETHFRETHQDLEFANAARDSVLRALGFRNVKFWDDLPNKVESVNSDWQSGYALAIGIDPHGRLIAQLFAADRRPPCATGKKHGDRVWVTPKDLDQSLNMALLRGGLAYGEFYSTMPFELARHMARRVESARQAKRGLWPKEHVNRRRTATIANLAAAESKILWPKLFRRLAAYFLEGNLGLGAFDAWLREDPINRDDLIVLPSGEQANMHNLVQVQGNRIRMRYDPEDLVILPDP